MTFKGKIKNGVVVLPPEARLPEGAEVEIVPDHPLEDTGDFLLKLKGLIKSRPHWPKDYSLNHGHYVSGEPKKQ